VPTTYNITLPASKTYPEPGCRTGAFKKYTKPGYPVVGILDLCEVKKKGLRPSCRKYLVQQVKGQPTFQVTKVGGKEDYTVTLRSDFDACTCQGFFRGTGQCSHGQALRALLLAGVVPGPAQGAQTRAPSSPVQPLSRAGRHSTPPKRRKAPTRA